MSNIRREDFYFTNKTELGRIPDGNKQCPQCHGWGEVVKIYRDPGPNEMTSCPLCGGKSYLPVVTEKLLTKEPVIKVSDEIKRLEAILPNHLVQRSWSLGPQRMCQELQREITRLKQLQGDNPA